MEKTILLNTATTKTTQCDILSHQWGHAWGELLWTDYDQDTVFSWYRTTPEGNLLPPIGGQNEYLGLPTGPPYDSVLCLWQRPMGALYGINSIEFVYQASDYDIFDEPILPSGVVDAMGGSITLIEVRQGPVQRLNADQIYIIEHQLSTKDLLFEGWDLELCTVKYKGKIVTYLFPDPSLTDMCNPGAFGPLFALPPVETRYSMYLDQATQTLEDLQVSGTVASGSNTLTIKFPWISTNTENTTGFYLNAYDLQPSAYLQLYSPTATGITQISSIIDSGTVSIDPPLTSTFTRDDTTIYYWYSDINKQHYIEVATGDSQKKDGTKTTNITINTKTGLETFTTIEAFKPIPWAIPAPYSIRNVPYTTVWLRLQNPGIPLNVNTIIFKVNNIDVTSQVQFTLVQGGVELLYSPTVEFELASKVYIKLWATATPNITRTLARASVVGSEYLKIGGGDLSSFQAGGFLEVGPNPAEQSESVLVRSLVAEDEILVESLQYEYPEGTSVQFTYSDYPLEVNYWFDIVTDFRPPVIYNLYPNNLATNQPRNTTVSFEVYDDGLGVDITSLTLTVNNIVVFPTIYEYNEHYYGVSYTPTFPYYYDSVVYCFATVHDKSVYQNRAFAVWSFTVEASEGPLICNPWPSYCAFPVHLKDDIKVDMYGRGGGISEGAIVFTIEQKAYEPIKYPKLYRFS